jgi:hypothetical protein
VVGVPILFTDKTFVLDFTSIATLFAFVLVCGGVLLIPRKEKMPGRFNIPYINGQLIYPLLVGGAIAILAIFGKGYFKDKVDFSFEKKIDALSAMMPEKGFDTVAVSAQAENYLMAKSGSDSVLIKLTGKVQAASVPGEKVAHVKEFVSEYSTTQMKTTKISLVIFWLVLVTLSLLTLLRKYSLIPLLGVSTCLYLLTGMTLSNWLWFGGWLVLGLIIYLLYGYKRSKLATQG